MCRASVMLSMCWCAPACNSRPKLPRESASFGAVKFAPPPSPVVFSPRLGVLLRGPLFADCRPKRIRPTLCATGEGWAQLSFVAVVAGMVSATATAFLGSSLFFFGLFVSLFLFCRVIWVRRVLATARRFGWSLGCAAPLSFCRRSMAQSFAALAEAGRSLDVWSNGRWVGSA